MLALAAVSVGAAAGGVTAQSETNPHWGQYQWRGGAETADVRAFWLIDRTGDATVSHLIKAVAGEWNGAREDHPELPYIGVYKDDANVGKCFVNSTPGWSAASACMLPFPSVEERSLTARLGSPHMIGAAFAISPGLSWNESFTAVCHAIGHVMGLEDSDDSTSCMSPQGGTDQAKWYSAADAEAILALYGHNEPGNPGSGSTTTSSTAPTATTVTTEAPSTTTSTTTGGTTTTEVPATTTTTSESILPTVPTVPSTIPVG